MSRSAARSEDPSLETHPLRAHVQRAILAAPALSATPADAIHAVRAWLLARTGPTTSPAELRGAVAMASGPAVTWFDDALAVVGRARWSLAHALVVLELTADPTCLVLDLLERGVEDEREERRRAAARVQAVARELEAATQSERGAA